MADGVKGITTLVGSAATVHPAPPKDQTEANRLLSLAWCAGLIRVCCWVQQAAAGSCRLRRWSPCAVT